MGGRSHRPRRSGWGTPRLERAGEPLLPRDEFLLRAARFALAAAGLVFLALGIGVVGYRGFEGLSWVDALVNASMILGGMGPVAELHTTGGKLFASAYALFSGLVFLAAAGLIFTPLLHRLLHRFHLDDGDSPPGGPARGSGPAPPRLQSR